MTKFIIFIRGDSMVICTSETLKETLTRYTLNDKNDAPDGYDRKEVEAFYIDITPHTTFNVLSSIEIDAYEEGEIDESESDHKPENRALDGEKKF